jgi:hypothetical protein
VVSIGGVTVAVDSNGPGVSRSETPDYGPFVVPGPRSPGLVPDITVDVVAGLPAGPSGDLLFSCDGAWSAYPDEAGYRIVVWTGRAGEAHLVARCSPDTSHVVIHVSEQWAGFFAAVDADGEPRTEDPFRYPLDQILLMNHLASRGGLIVHSAGVEWDGLGFVLPGVCDAGKTTFSRLVAESGSGDGLLSDDRTILRTACGGGPGSGSIEAWGTPWPGEAEIARSAHVPLRGLLFLMQDPMPAVVPLTPAEAAKRLFAVISCPWYDRELSGAVLETIEKVVGEVPSYEFHFPPDERAVDLLRRHTASLS